MAEMTGWSQTETDVWGDEYTAHYKGVRPDGSGCLLTIFGILLLAGGLDYLCSPKNNSHVPPRPPDSSKSSQMPATALRGETPTFPADQSGGPSNSTDSDAVRQATPPNVVYPLPQGRAPESPGVMQGSEQAHLPSDNALSSETQQHEETASASSLRPSDGNEKPQYQMNGLWIVVEQATRSRNKIVLEVTIHNQTSEAFHLWIHRYALQAGEVYLVSDTGGTSRLVDATNLGGYFTDELPQSRTFYGPGDKKSQKMIFQAEDDRSGAEFKLYCTFDLPRTARYPLRNAFQVSIAGIRLDVEQVAKKADNHVVRQNQQAQDDDDRGLLRRLFRR